LLSHSPTRSKRRQLRLIANADRRLRLGHLWIFSNEVDVGRTPLDAFAPGELASVVDAAGHPVGTAYVNPRALICARILASDAAADIDARWFSQRLRRALALRERIYSTWFYRAVYGESDGLPGLVIDRYGEVLVLQLNTAGMVALRDDLLLAVREVFQPRGMVLTTPEPVRALEGLEPLDEDVDHVPEEVAIDEGDLRFIAPLRGGQKTGFYYDQRDNRARLARYVRGARVLDLYSYIGTWGVSALAAGAREALCIDSSAFALSFARRNGAENQVRVEVEEEDALAALERLAREKRRFDVVILDPPALVKRKKDLAAGLSQYERLNEAAMRTIADDGFLITSSCSHHVDGEKLRSTVLRAGKKASRRVQLLERHGHAPDHPVHPAMPETEYLKTLFCRID